MNTHTRTDVDAESRIVDADVGGACVPLLKSG